jgi:hypothetical protein
VQTAAATQELRPELSAEEQQLKERLGAHLQHLAGKLGERTPSRPWELADASDYVAQTLEAYGYPLERQGYELDGAVAQNLTVRVGGGERGDQVILVTAHYDSKPGDPGRSGAGATAALLELARQMRGAKLKRTIQFSAFALGESPHGDGEDRGARRYVRAVQQKRAREQEKLAREEEQKRRGELPADLPPPPIDQSRFVAMISLGRLLSFRPHRAGGESPVWVGVHATEKARPFAEAIAQELDAPPFLVEQSPLLASEEDSDARAFIEAGVPVVFVDAREAEPQVKDDLDGLARVVMALRRALGVMAEEKPFTEPGSLLGALD